MSTFILVLLVPYVTQHYQLADGLSLIVAFYTTLFTLSFFLSFYFSFILSIRTEVLYTL
ncbi:hypothetical protein BDV25DRAFT_159692 [Aspergillus avenaceus]|uniref:Uncharacterized protein n=1 Tax=Aspergillus avenaceus TaxID=36643 RepID=A0A5N6TN92_ASPAV|nr:hypothetical protein BDV25DRAFT_159692 [Aspergillus avenaceus]